MTGAGGERGARVVEKAPSLTLSLKAEQAHGEGATPLDGASLFPHHQVIDMAPKFV